MESAEIAIVTSVISGAFAMATAFGSVWLKNHLERSRPEAEVALSPAQAGARVAGQPTWTASIARSLFILFVSFAIGAGYRHFKTTGGQAQVALTVFYFFLVVSFLGLVLFHRRSRNGLWPYQLEVFALWTAFASGYLVVHGKLWDDLVVSTIIFWLAFAIIGGAIILATRPRNVPT